MNTNKIILAFFMIIMIFSLVNAESFFKSYDENSTRIITGLNTFKLSDLTNNPKFLRYEIEIYNKHNPENKINYNMENFEIKQINPFLEPGVYVINVKAYTRNNEYVEKFFEYIYDNTDLMPPLIPINLEDSLQKSGSSYILRGKAVPDSIIYVEYLGQIKTDKVDDKGNFELQLTGLNSDLIYLKFYLKKDNRVSEIVERTLLLGNYEPKYLTDVSEIKLDNLVSLNDNTINGITTKQNFYVQGTINTFEIKSGSVVFVNGQKTITDGNGKFGAFILLNEGENEIVVQAANIKKRYEISYENLKFQFTSLNYDKIVGNSNVNINGEVNLDVPFLVLVNGNYFNKIIPKNNNFDFTVSNLNEGKNFIQLIGKDNERKDLIIYYDVEKSVIKLLSSDKISKADKLVFKITDDVSPNLNSIKLTLDGEIVSSDKLDIKDNLYSFDISDITEDGIYTYVLTGEDFVGRLFEDSGTISISSKNALIEDIYFDGTLIGNKLFIKSGDVQLNLIPSTDIAFKSIFLDGEEQVDYEILRSGKVRLNLDIQKDQGFIDFKFINKDYVEFTQSFEYFSDMEEPILKLDYVDNSASIDKVKVTGEIEDSNFNWNTLRLNDQNSCIKYGRYFECLIDIKNSGENNLIVSGEDYSNNYFTKTFGSILYKDEKETEVELDVITSNFTTSLGGNLYGSDESKGVYSFVKKYDGFSFDRLYLSSDDFDLPLVQRYGIKSINLEGIETSNKRFYSYKTYTEKLKYDFGDPNVKFDPEIFVYGLNQKTFATNIVIQGYVKASSDLKSVKVNENNCKIYENSFVCNVDLKIGDNSFTIIVTDSDGEQVYKEVTVERLTDDLEVEITDLAGEVYKDANYLLGNDLELYFSLSEEANLKVLIDGYEIFEGYNVKEPISLDLGFEIDAIESKEINVQLEAETQDGKKAFSEVLKLTYKKLFDTLASVIVG